MPNTGLPIVSRRLREARERTGLSQKALGISAGIDEFSASPRVNQYERGKHVPDLLTLKNLAAVLMVPVPYFYAEDELLAELMLLLHSLPRQQWHEVKKYLARKSRAAQKNL
ncbi:MAG: XRE family transcriptional regulator [Rhodocyclaceae bacterium]|nr:MAG: XRE family transcriptional regulator [Rhodocyclaceae bacterium]TND03170.1 MAG: XRE family transcriptional regulator [Rhodocyclaceae bacterium]